MIQVALVQVLAPVNGPGISERTLPGDRVAEPRWSFILETGTRAQARELGGGWARRAQAGANSQANQSYSFSCC